MLGWTKLHEQITDSEFVCWLMDEHPRTANLLTLMMAKARVWGRFPAAVRPFSKLVTGMCLKFTPSSLEKHWALLETPWQNEERGWCYRYEIGGREFLQITKHFVYNPDRDWHRVGKPEYPHPPDFIAPPSLVRYLSAVEAGRYHGKDKLPLTLKEEMSRLELTETYLGESGLGDDSLRVVSESGLESTLTRARARTRTSALLCSESDSESEGEGTGKDIAAVHSPHTETDHLYGAEQGIWDVLLAEISPGIPRAGGQVNRRDWTLALAHTDADPAYPLHGDDLAQALRTAPPSGVASPRRYLENLERRYHAQQGERTRKQEGAVAQETTLPPTTHEHWEAPPDLTPEQRQAALEASEQVRRQLIADGILPDRQLTAEEITEREQRVGTEAPA